MKPFLSAAALAVALPALAAPDPLLRTPPRQALTQAQQACRQLEASTAANPERVRLKRLGDLPPAALQRAVLRRVDGCPVLEVKLDGRFVYVPSVRDAQPRRDLRRGGR